MRTAKEYKDLTTKEFCSRANLGVEKLEAIDEFMKLQNFTITDEGGFDVLGQCCWCL